MSSKGWIKLHRKLLSNPIFQDPYLLKLWTYCLLKASHSKHKQLVGSEVIELEEGQFIWGRIEATTDLNKGSKPSERKSESTWERYLKLLEKLEILNRKTNNKYTVITIVNWGVYQHENDDNEQQGEQEVNSKRTADEQQVNTNKNVKNVRIKELKNKDINVQSRKYNFERRHLKLANLLFKKIKENNPTAKEPNLKSWANTFRLMMERDKREGKEIQELIIWTQEHHFWYQNILSANKLRQQYDRLNLQKKDDGLKVVNGGRNKEVVPDWFNKQKQEEQPNSNDKPKENVDEAELAALLQKHAGG